MADNSSAAGGCFGLVGIFLIASCVFGGGDKAANADTEITPEIASTAPSVGTSPETANASTSDPSPADVSKQKARSPSSSA